MLKNDVFINFPSEESRKNYLNQIMSYPFEGFVQSNPDNPLRPVGMSNKKREEARSSKTWKEYYYDAMTNYQNVLGYVREGYIVVTVKGDIALKIRSMCIEEGWQCIMFADDLSDRLSLVFKNSDIQTDSGVVTAGGFTADYCAYSLTGYELLKSGRVFDIIWVPEDLNTKNDSICEIPMLFMPSHKRCGISFQETNTLELHDWILGLAANGYDKDMLLLLLSKINSNLLDSPLSPEELRSVVTIDEMKSVVKTLDGHIYTKRKLDPSSGERPYVISYPGKDKTKRKIEISQNEFSIMFMSSYEFGYTKGSRGENGVKYEYNPELGIWKILYERDLQQKIRQFEPRLSDKQISGVMNIICLDWESNAFELRDDEHIDKVYLAFKNTTIEVSDKGIREVERKKEYGLTCIFDYNYIPVPNYQEGDTILKEIFSHNDDKLLYFLEVAGVSLTKMQLKNMFFLTGDRDNGKSSVLNLWTECLPESLVTTINFKQIDDEKHIYNLASATVNIDDDERAGTIKNPEVFKKIIGSGYMSGRQLYQQPVTFRCHAKMIVSCNTMPQVYDFNLQQKLIEIPFIAKFNSETVTVERKLEVKRILASYEMHEFFLNCMVQALRIYFQDGQELVECDEIKKASKEYLDCTKTFVQEWLDTEEGTYHIDLNYVLTHRFMDAWSLYANWKEVIGHDRVNPSEKNEVKCAIMRHFDVTYPDYPVKVKMPDGNIKSIRAAVKK